MTPAKILIVDDEPNIRLTVRTSLEAAGHVVAEADNGRAALERIQAGSFDLVMLDLGMPALDGMGMLNELRAVDGPKPRVIVMTAYGSIPVAVRATLAGASDFIEKPSTPDELRATVAAVLNSADLRQPGTPPGDALSAGYDAVIERIREAMRAGKWESAESLLMKAADLSLRDAAYFNLLGVLYEARGAFDLARKFYGKAMAAQRGGYPPAEQNIRRLYEFARFGKSHVDVDLGEQPALSLRYR